MENFPSILTVMRKDKKYRIISILSLLVFVFVCIIASIPIKMGINNWMQFGNPDNLGLGIGFSILIILGIPFLIISIGTFLESRKNNELNS